MEIEKIATTTVVQSISRTDILSSFINDGDKEPCWDGAIYVYNNRNKKKENLKGRVPVQVKGKRVSGSTVNKEITYPIEVIDLKNYLNDGGTVFFVVYMNEKNEEQIYYAALLPFYINCLLYEKEEQKTISVKLKPFPITNNEKCNIFLDFVADSKHQKGKVEPNVLSLKDFSTIKEIDELSFSYTGLGYNPDRPFEYLFTHQVYLYAKPKGLNIKIPVQYLEKIDVAKTTIKKSVEIEGHEFYTAYEVLHRIDRDELQFGKSIRLGVYKNGEVKLDYKLNGTLNERICDVEFIIALLKKQKITIEGTDIPLAITKDEIAAFGIDELEDNLHYMQEVRMVLDELKVAVDLDCSNLSSRDEKLIQVLVAAIKYKEPVKFDTNNSIPVMARLNFSNLTLVLMYEKIEDNSYIIKNLSDENKWRCEAEDVNGNKFPSSIYMILKKNDFREICNIDYEDMWKSIISIEQSEVYLEYVNMLLLQMILAYDEGAIQQDKLFEVALKIAHFLKDEERFSENIAKLNYLQLLKRKGELSDNQVDELCKMIQTPNQNTEILIGAHLLMDNQLIAKRYFNNLSNEEQKEFRKFPISKFIQF
ncbi:DUF4365 domain-containing protein [Cellulosilyticum sp. I15G10I2]|uniref:DUF4365 domain-containing protein n=1 Tax=Cellulosilyticum sp. I15G10I2 TaxID=1892843 RepID=UPI00085BE2F3|nr:DUF4365 domain-containing protein [Cellulosilyticum sp. I15G10I2]